MNKEELNNYFVNAIKNNGENIKICLMTHNSGWTRFAPLVRKYPNLQMDFFGNSTYYLHDSYAKNVASDYDIIALNSNETLNGYEIQNLNQLALSCTNTTGKKVIVAYNYYMYDRKNKSYKETAIIYYDNEQVKKTLYINDINELDDYFMDIALKSYNDFKPETKVKTKKIV